MKINFICEIFVSYMELKEFRCEILISYVKLPVKFLQGKLRQMIQVQLGTHQRYGIIRLNGSVLNEKLEHTQMFETRVNQHT